MLSRFRVLPIEKAIAELYDQPDVPLFLFANGASSASGAHVFTWAASDAYEKLTRGFYRQVTLVPKPARSIPIWLGGSGEAAFDRAARLADGFIFFGGGIDHNVDAWNRLRERVGGLGRSVEDFGGDYVALPPGDLGDLTEEVGAWREAGGTHVSVVTMGRGLDSIDGHINHLASVADALSLS